MKKLILMPGAIKLALNQTIGEKGGELNSGTKHNNAIQIKIVFFSVFPFVLASLNGT